MNYERPLFKSHNLCPFAHSSSAHRRRLRVADILLADQDHGGGGPDCIGQTTMDSVGETPRPRHGSPSINCDWPRRIVARLLTAPRPAKEQGVVQRRQKKMQNEARDLETTSLRSRSSINGLNGSEESGQLHRDDTSFKLGVGFGFLCLIAASKNGLGKMVELRNEMEELLQKVRGELQSKDALVKPLKHSDALACSITDIREVSSSNSNLSIHSQTPYVQPGSKGDMVHNHFLEYNTSEQDESAEGINELQAEFEVELERLQLYLDGEASFEDTQQERVKLYSRMAEKGNWQVTVKDCHTEGNSLNFCEIIDPEGATADVSFGVPPVELERRLHELLEARLQERVAELESALECTTQKLIEKEIELTWWKDTARLISLFVPETSRFTFRLDPETALKLR